MYIYIDVYYGRIELQLTMKGFNLPVLYKGCFLGSSDEITPYFDETDDAPKLMIAHRNSSNVS